MKDHARPWDAIWPDLQQALTKECSQKELRIQTYVSGQELFFEAKISRHADNDLFMSAEWQAAACEEAAAFLRHLADFIEKRS